MTHLVKNKATRFTFLLHDTGQFSFIQSRKTAHPDETALLPLIFGDEMIPFSLLKKLTRCSLICNGISLV